MTFALPLCAGSRAASLADLRLDSAQITDSIAQPYQDKPKTLQPVKNSGAAENNILRITGRLLPKEVMTSGKDFLTSDIKISGTNDVKLAKQNFFKKLNVYRNADGLFFELETAPGNNRLQVWLNGTKTNMIVFAVYNADDAAKQGVPAYAYVALPDNVEFNAEALKKDAPQEYSGNFKADLSYNLPWVDQDGKHDGYLAEWQKLAVTVK